MGPRSITRIDAVPKFLQERIAYAIKNRVAYIVGDKRTSRVVPPFFDEFDDNEDIAKGVKAYEEKVGRVSKKLEEEERLGKEKGWREELEKLDKRRLELQNLLKKSPIPGSSKTAQKRPLLPDGASNDEEDTGPKPKRVRVVNINHIGIGPENHPPCDRCLDLKGCHQQVPPQVSCYECKKSRQSCSFVVAQKAAQKPVTKKPEKVEFTVETDEDVKPARHSTLRAAPARPSVANGRVIELNCERDQMETRKANILEHMVKMLDSIAVDLRYIANPDD